MFINDFLVLPLFSFEIVILAYEMSWVASFMRQLA